MHESIFIATGISMAPGSRWHINFLDSRVRGAKEIQWDSKGQKGCQYLFLSKMHINSLKTGSGSSMHLPIQC